jgi:hypothetical protein
MLSWWVKYGLILAAYYQGGAVVATLLWLGIMWSGGHPWELD